MKNGFTSHELLGKIDGVGRWFEFLFDIIINQLDVISTIYQLVVNITIYQLDNQLL